MHGMSEDGHDIALFGRLEKVNIDSAAPLAVRMRPRTLDEFAGQSHFIGPDKLLRRMLEAGRLSSLIFYGPPGVGKTSLAMVIANYTKAEFRYLSAPAATVKDIRAVIAAARDRLAAVGLLLEGPSHLSGEEVPEETDEQDQHHRRAENRPAREHRGLARPRLLNGNLTHRSSIDQPSGLLHVPSGSSAPSRGLPFAGTSRAASPRYLSSAARRRHAS